MYYKIFTIVAALIAFVVATIAGTITIPVIGQQNQQPINLTTLLTSTPVENNTAPDTTANMTTTTSNVNATVASNVDAPANMTIEDAKQLYLSVWNQTKFNATFSTFVEPFSVAGYGVYEERSNVFSPGEAIVLYVEPVGFGHKQIIDKEGDGSSNNNNNNTMLYLMNITADYEIDAANGTKLQLIEDVQAGSITSHRPNTEMPLTLTITPEVQPLPVGSYVVKYSVTDEISGESFQLKKNIVVTDRKG
ncbi:MAG: hypothetical protein M3261_03420 [Thermoproteota archaeon]|nr:hypothetical protein [Thermoproteota archaeon]